MLPQPNQGPNPLAQAPAHAGPVTVPQANQGNAAAALVDVKNAVQLLQKALPMIPLGSPLHADILEVTKKLSKHVSQEGGGTDGLQLQSLLQMIKQSTQNSPMQAMMRMNPAQAPNAAPATMPTPTPGE